MQSITSTDWVNTTNTGFMGGFFAGLHKNRVTLRAEVLISTTQYKSIVPIDSEGNIGNFNIVHLNVPVLLDVEIIKNHLSVYAGPQYSNMISATKKTAFDGDPKVVFKSGEFAGVAGIEGKFCKHILIGGRYVYGFTDLNNEAFTSTEKWQNRAFQVYIGYSFL